MALKYGFFNAVEQSNGSYDCEYDAAFYTHFLNDYFCSAIPAGCFEVTKGDGLTLNVSSGHGIINGVYFYDDSASTLTCAAATGTRVDLVVARLNATARTVELAVKQGTTSASDNELALAKVTVTGSTVTTVSNISYTQIFRYTSDTTDTTNNSSTDSSSGGSTSGGSTSGGSSTSSGNTSSSGVLVSKISSTVSSPTVHYSTKYDAAKNGSNLSVQLTFAAWLNSSGSKLGTGAKLTIYARVNGGAWQSVVIKKTSDSWSGTTQHTASLTLTATTTASTATVEFYVTRNGSTYSGTAGNLASAASPKKYTIKLT